MLRDLLVAEVVTMVGLQYLAALAAPDADHGAETSLGQKCYQTYSPIARSPGSRTYGEWAVFYSACLDAIRY